MSGKKFQITVLGTRGSMAVSGDEYAIFGGATSCYLVRGGDDSIFLDAGSGLINAPTKFKKTPSIFLSHYHLDHMLGLGMYPRLFQKGSETALYLPFSMNGDYLSVLNGLFSPPYWPVRLSVFGENIKIKPLILPVQQGDILVEGMLGNHPGGCYVFKVSCGGKSLVYITDYEYQESSFSAIISFARDSDLLLYDGQYKLEDCSRRKGFGHSSAEIGIELLERSGAKQMLLIHHDPLSTDDLLLQREAAIGRSDVSFAREGETIVL